MGGRWRVEGLVVVVVAAWGWVGVGAETQDEAGPCYGPGSVAGAVVGTLIVTGCLLASAFFLYKMYWKSRKGKHLVLVTDTENLHDQYAFDNPCFREATSVKHESKLEKSKLSVWPPVHTFGRDHKGEKLTSMDDSCVKDSRVQAVTLRSHDFTGLGFNICGNMRDGIFVKDVLHRGPAFESGKINSGDRIDSVCISFRNMVFEDALTILSYASPYDVQVRLESDSCSRPSTLMRSKRESSAVNCSDRILHPKFTRSQSVPHSKEMSNGISKKSGQQSGLVPERNRTNHSPNKRPDLLEHPTNKASSPGNKSKAQKMSAGNDSPRGDSRSAAVDSHQKSSDSQNKLHKFGIKVLPISMNPKMGAQSASVAKKPISEPPAAEEKPKNPSRTASPVDEKLSADDESDAGRENVKAMLAKGFLSLKERINQNTLGRKRKAEEETGPEEGAECPVPRRRSSVTWGAKAQEQSRESESGVPEEVFRAGDVARTNRRSVAEGRKGGEDVEEEVEGEGSRASESEESSDRESSREEAKRPKRSKGKAPSPPKGGAAPKEMDEIKRGAEIVSEETGMVEGGGKTPASKGEEEEEEDGKQHPSYDSDSDGEAVAVPKDGSPTKIELSATQVTVHHSPAGEGNDDDDVEPGRKAASLGDLSRLDSEQPLSIVLERAVSLDLTEGTSQSAKKRKAPMPPSEEFPPAFDERSYRKDTRLEGLTTFQRRLKKSSDFGTLEDALQDDSKPPELDKISPRDLSEAHSYNIQEFSSWLAECRRPKVPQPHSPPDAPSRDDANITATSFVNINSPDSFHDDAAAAAAANGDNHKFHKGNVSFRVNGTDFPDFDPGTPPINFHFAPPTSRTVVVISQPNSLEPPNMDPPLGPPGPPTSVAPDPRPQATNGPDHSPAPNTAPNTLSSPLSSPLTYVTEIRVSTPQQPSPHPAPDDPPPVSVSDRIHAFDSLDPPHPPFPKPLPEGSRIPIRAMKSETGQRVLATIQSLARESSSSSTAGKAPQAEYAKRVASLLSSGRRSEGTLGDDGAPRLSVSGLYLKGSPPKPSKEFKVPPVVPPRKTETLASGSRDRSVVTLSSFVGGNQGEEGGVPKVSLGAKRGEGRGGEMNGRQEGLVPVAGGGPSEESS